MSENISDNATPSIKSMDGYDDKFKLKAGIFLTTVTGMSAIIGFGATVAATKKQDPHYFTKGIVGSIEMTETGASLALRALGWGTLYAFAGCGILCYSIWKISGATDMKDFKAKIGAVLPKLPKNDPPQGRTEFSGLNDLLTYISTERSKKD